MGREAKCQGSCNRHLPTNLMKKINNPSKGWHYLCQECYNYQHSYSTENKIFKGKNLKGRENSISLEFEVSIFNKEPHQFLAQYGWLNTSDCTVQAEYKTPIYTGSLNSLVRIYKSIDKNFDIPKWGEDYGTHTNVGHKDKINTQTIGYLRRFYHSLFIPLSNHLKANTNKTIQLWGRDFTYYANYIDKYSDPLAHTNFINLQHVTHVEFRLCRYINAHQFAICNKFCIEAVNCIITNFINHFNDLSLTTDTNAIKIYRKKKADITANKLINLFEKYVAKV